jgi:hypothetical protein
LGGLADDEGLVQTETKVVHKNSHTACGDVTANIREISDTMGRTHRFHLIWAQTISTCSGGHSSWGMLDERKWS